MADPDAGSEYAKLIQEQLDEERKVKASLERRGITVVTTSGTLVTLLFGLVAVVTKASDFEVTTGARWFIYVALGLFVAAAVCALATNFPQKYEEADPDELQRLITEDYWQTSQGVGSRRSSELRVKVLRSARAAHTTKACLLRWALGIEVVAAGALAIAVVQLLWE